MKRRDLLLGVFLGLLLCPSSTSAQEAKVPIVAFLITHPPVTDPVVQWFRDGLAKYGYEDGSNIKLEVRTALGQLDRVPQLAKELVDMPADVIVLVNDISMRAVMEYTRTIPIVSVGYTNDPLALGWIESYRRPGGNVTGIYNVNRTLGPKRLEILKEVLPSASRVAVFYDPALGKRELREIQQYAPRLGLQLIPIAIKSAGDLEDAFDAAAAKKAGAVLLLWTPIVYLERSRVAALGLQRRLPVVCDIHPIVEEGALISLGSDAEYPFERVAFYVDRILNGTPVADIPVEQVSKLKFVVNLKTARELDVEIPQSILLRADEVIE